MIDSYAPGFGAIFIIAIPMILGYVLAKAHILNKNNGAKFSQTISVILALGAATFADGPRFSIGRIGILIIVYFFLSVTITFGVLIGIEKAEK